MIGQKRKIGWNIIEKKCLTCSSDFMIKIYRINTAKYCSYKCSASGTKNRKGTTTSEIGIKNMSAGRIGKSFMTDEGKEITRKRMVGNKYCVGRVPGNFKGEKVGYRALHRWVEQHLGKSRVCSSCDSFIIGRGIHWANKSGNYKRELSDWLRLCAKCHKAYDSKKMVKIS